MSTYQIEESELESATNRALNLFSPVVSGFLRQSGFTEFKPRVKLFLMSEGLLYPTEPKKSVARETWERREELKRKGSELTDTIQELEKLNYYITSVLGL